MYCAQPTAYTAAADLSVLMHDHAKLHPRQLGRNGLDNGEQAM